MGDHQDGAFKIHQRLFNHFSRINIKMVCWFIKNQKLVLLVCQFGKNQPDSFAEAEVRNFFENVVSGKEKLTKNFSRIFFEFFQTQRLQKLLFNSIFRIQNLVFLGKVSKIDFFADFDLSGIRFQNASGNFYDGCFSGAVLAF